MVYKFYTQDIDITPTNIEFGVREILLATKSYFNVTNKHQYHDIVIKGVITSTPELSIFLNDGNQLP